jgi:hypothetical protein
VNLNEELVMKKADRILVALGAAVVLAACAGQPAQAPSAQAPMGDRMWFHFGETSVIQTAVLEGDLNRVAEPARLLAQNASSSGLPPGSDTYVEALRGYARSAAEASDLSAAALATGQLGATCGSCHQGLGQGPRFDSEGWPAASSTYVGGHMIRHMWAADRLWEGLVGPSDEAWTAGATSLAGEPLRVEELGLPAQGVDEAKKLAGLLHDLGGTAESITDPSERGRTYGRVLATCASCHELAGR